MECYLKSERKRLKAGNETCLYLNVWTDDLQAKKPVIVFFHGGGSNGMFLTILNDRNYYLPDIDDAKATQRLNELYGDNAEQIITLYQEAYPDHPLPKALFVCSNASMISRGQLINRENGMLNQLNAAGLDALHQRRPQYHGV